MFKTYEFPSPPFELPIERKSNITCKVWEADHPSPSVVLIEYDFGKDLDDKELNTFAEDIVSKYQMSVVSIEYAETKIKKSPDLLSKLESYLPEHLRTISTHLSDRHKELINIGAFQDVINDLQFNPYHSIPANKNTIIPLYGDEHSYTDFGVVASLDILFGINELRKKYSSWLWNDCIGVGSGYGAYVLQLAEKFVPNTFSLIIGKNSMIKPVAADIFTNGTELVNGKHQFFYKKSIGEFPLYLNEVQGWTSDKNHSFFFEQRHFDIRNLENDVHLQRSKKETPLIFIEEVRPYGLEEKINFVEKLINNNFPVELLVADEEEIDGVAVYKEAGNIVVNLERIFDQYMTSNYSRNIKDIHEEIEVKLYPVYNGVYILSSFLSKPNLVFIPANDQLTKENELEYIGEYFNDLNNIDKKIMEELFQYIKKPLLAVDEDYLKLI